MPSTKARGMRGKGRRGLTRAQNLKYRTLTGQRRSYRKSVKALKGTAIIGNEKWREAQVAHFQGLLEAIDAQIAALLRDAG